MILHKEFTERDSDFTDSTGWVDSWGGDDDDDDDITK